MQNALAILTVLVLTAAPTAQARSFWQTYGATVATPEGCAWNVNSDYFVPRTCATGQYGLFSACKTPHSLSTACRNLHPIYAGYCTPFGACHYKRRDHVYQKHCGCTPLACTYGPWHLDKCHKHCRMTPLRPIGCGACGASGCGTGVCHATPAIAGEQLACSNCPANSGFVGGYAGYGGYGEYVDPSYLPNVEPFGGEVLGAIQAFPAGMGAAAGGGMGLPGVMPVINPGPNPEVLPFGAGRTLPPPDRPIPATTIQDDAQAIPKLYGA